VQTRRNVLEPLRHELGVAHGLSLGTIRAADRHPPRRLGERREPVARVETVRVAGREHEVAEAGQIGVRHHRVHQESRDAVPAMLGQDEHVAEPGECRAIGHHPREPDLDAVYGVSRERAEADGTLDGALDDVSRHALGPVRLIVKKPPHQIAIDVLSIARNRVLGHRSRV
jgi:hypothetical protein